MKRKLLVLLLALMTSVPMLADVIINETNFPDENFRNYLLTNTQPTKPNMMIAEYCGINGYGADGKFTDAELDNIRGITLANVANTKGIEFFTKLVFFKCTGITTETVDLSNNTWLQKINLQGSFSNLVLPQNQSVIGSTGEGGRLSKVILDAPNITTFDFETNIPHIQYLFLNNTSLTTVDLSYSTFLTGVGIENPKEQIEITLPSNPDQLLVFNLRNTKQTSVDLSKCTALKQLDLHNNNDLASLSLPENADVQDIIIKNNPKLTSLNVANYANLLSLTYTGNGFKSVDLSNNTALKGLRCYGNDLTSLDVSNLTNLVYLFCHDNKLTSLDLSNNTALKGLTCDGNCLTELNLSSNINLKSTYTDTSTDIYNSYSNKGFGAGFNYNPGASVMYWEVSMYDQYIPKLSLSPQNIDKDYVAIDGRSKLGVQCNTNDGVLTSYGTYSAVTSTGDINNKYNNYIIVGDGTTDVHAYRDTISYSYNTGYTGDYDAAKTMEVNISTSAHGMYVHPETKTTEYDNSYNGFYWGTLYLEFPATIPYGVQCYYAKTLDVNEDLANLTEVTGTIPARTAVIVKAPTEPKFFAFNEDFETPAPDAPDDNIMAGTIEVLPVAKRSVLTLGFNVSNQDGEEGQFGFWDYVGTRINPFRAYVPKSNLPAGAKGGFSLLFPEDGTTGVARLTNDGAVQDGTWFTLSGVRLNGKPTAKGIYVNGGKKVVIK